jgi:hypothetical protein
MSRTYRSSRPCNFVSPRQPLDASMRFHAHGPVQGMDYDDAELGKIGWLAVVLFVVTVVVCLSWGLA